MLRISGFIPINMYSNRTFIVLIVYLYNINYPYRYEKGQIRGINKLERE